MPSFKHTLVGLGPICDADCIVQFSKRDVTVFSPEGTPILTGWRDTLGAKLWKFALKPHEKQIPPKQLDSQETSLTAYSAYDLPSVQALVRYLHAAAGFPVKSTWLKAIKAGNFATWPGLTYSNAAKYYPESSETLKGHLVQSSKGVRSTKTKPAKTPTSNPTPTEESGLSEEDDQPLPPIQTGEVHI